MNDAFGSTTQFLLRQARPLERRLFAAIFLNEPAAGVVEALRGYQNEDGGFGHALEPDKRCPASLPAEVAGAMKQITDPARCAKCPHRGRASAFRPPKVGPALADDGSMTAIPGGRPVRLIRLDPAATIDTTRWPATVPAVEQVLSEGLELPAGLTVLAGENGSGKSTLMEVLAEACGLNPQGGSVLATLRRTRDSEPRMGQHFIVERGPGRPRWSYFLRADTMHGLYTYLEENPGRRPERFHELSHGEGFLEILRTRVNQPGFYLMDEPDAPLSFVSCLGLAALLHDLVQADSQAVVATHSPVLAAVPGASIFELGDWGIRPTDWEGLNLVSAWRGFLADPAAYFRHLCG